MTNATSASIRTGQLPYKVGKDSCQRGYSPLF
ncbi:Uncharacterised protein [Segatella copri]|nr:Uncharacterised protein [Segatella copri]